MNNSFKQQGYFIYQFENLTALIEIQSICEQVCRKFIGEQFRGLHNYHDECVSEELHEKLQFEIFKGVNEGRLHHAFTNDNLGLFESLLGVDIDIQTEAYVRIARPGKKTDNIGIHRDVDYGNSAYEVSLSIALIDQKDGGGLSVLPQSHAYSGVTLEQLNREDVTKGSVKNRMGFLYSPKKLSGFDQSLLKSISLPFGSGLVFSCALIHGQEENKSDSTRWSIDFRVRNAFHPSSSSLKAGFYTPLRESEVTNLARQFYQLHLTEKSLLKGIEH